MRMLETRQSNTSPSKYLIELTQEEMRELFDEDTRQQIINKIFELKDEITPYPEN